ncbi:MAG: sugar phosphate isomerase/epimerase family protein [Xenococcaceae cyanobacterium]
MAKIGFMQGRLSPIEEGKIQAFPWKYWPDEFPLAQRHGFPSMEWTIEQERLYENPLMTEDGRQKIRRLCAQHGIEIPSLTGDCFMQAPFWKSDGERRTTLLDDMAAVLEAAAELGIRYIVVPLVDNGRLENEQQVEALYSGLETVHSLMRDADIQIAFESDFPPKRLQKFIASLDEALFGINYDIGNSAALGYDPSEEIAAYGSRILNVHVKDRILEGTTVPLGQGNADLPCVFQLLKETGYRGQYILQTARAVDGDHVGVLCRYRDMVDHWLD